MCQFQQLEVRHRETVEQIDFNHEGREEHGVGDESRNVINFNVAQLIRWNQAIRSILLTFDFFVQRKDFRASF